MSYSQYHGYQGHTKGGQRLLYRDDIRAALLSGVDHPRGADGRAVRRQDLLLQHPGAEAAPRLGPVSYMYLSIYVYMCAHRRKSVYTRTHTRVLQGPEKLPTGWSHIYNGTRVSCTSNRPQTDIGIHLGLCIILCQVMSQGICYGLVSVIISSCGKDMSMYMVVASNIRHGSYKRDR